MSANNAKENLELIAALTASTAGFIKNNVNGMMVGDSKFIKADIKPQDVIENAKKGLIKELTQFQQFTPPGQPAPQPPVLPQQPPLSQDLFNQPQRVVLPQVQQNTHNQPVNDPNQLTFNFDNSPTAQNIYYKLNTIIERIDRLNEKVNTLSEHILKKKLDKKKEKV